MMLALAWLTISAPVVYASYKMSKVAIEKQHFDQPHSDEDCNPFSSNTTEEKSGINTLSEYLHDPYCADHHYSIIDKMHKCLSSDIYSSFHPELISPPPEFS